MHIQDAFHPDGISYDSPEEFSDTDSDPRSSQEILDKNNSPAKEESGKNELERFSSIAILFSSG